MARAPFVGTKPEFRFSRKESASWSWASRVSALGSGLVSGRAHRSHLVNPLGLLSASASFLSPVTGRGPNFGAEVFEEPEVGATSFAAHHAIIPP